MNILISLLLVVQVVCAIGVIVLVLLQHGKGADMGAAFGGGASGSLFGATGSANFLSRATAALATLFFVCTLGLSFAYNKRGGTTAVPGSVMEQPADGIPGAAKAPVAPAAPVQGAPADAAPVAPQQKGAENEIPR